MCLDHTIWFQWAIGFISAGVYVMETFWLCHDFLFGSAFSYANRQCWTLLVIFETSIHLSCVSYVGGQTWPVLFLSLYVFQFKSCIVLLLVPRNMFRNKSGKLFSFLPSTLPFFFPSSPNFLLCFFHFTACPFCVNCSAVWNTYCTKGYNAACYFRLKTTYLQKL